MDDYHSNDVVYMYTDVGQVSTVTAPGSKTWDYDYNALGQPTRYSHPNSMVTYYSYDARNRMTKIKHGTTVKQSFTYDLDDVGNITTTTDNDGSLWEYEYDGRYRLTQAVRDNASTPTVTATYQYTYDDGDNLVTKVTPFVDDFNDGDYDGWSANETYWDASNGYVTNTLDSALSFNRPNTDPDMHIEFSYCRKEDDKSLHLHFRHVDWSNFIRLTVSDDEINLGQRVLGSWGSLASPVPVTSTVDTWYDVRIECDDEDVTVWHGERGGQMSQKLTADDAPILTTATMKFYGAADESYWIDNINIVSDDLGGSTTTYAYNDANEMTSTVVDNGTTSFYYDEWSRTISKSLGDYDATYEYRYGDKLCAVTSDFPDEGTVTYDYGGDGKRRQRTVGGVSTWYNWAGGNVINEESGTGSGSLTMTYIGKMAHVPGNSPSSGTYSYYVHDNLGSTRGLYNESRDKTAIHEFTPYGDMYSRYSPNSGTPTTHLFTGHDWDTTSQLYFAPYRYYNPNAARWTTRDPLGMVDGPNVYSYAQQCPVGQRDEMGLYVVTKDCDVFQKKKIGNAVRLIHNRLRKCRKNKKLVGSSPKRLSKRALDAVQEALRSRERKVKISCGGTHPKQPSAFGAARGRRRGEPRMSFRPQKGDFEMGLYFDKPDMKSTIFVAYIITHEILHDVGYPHPRGRGYQFESALMGCFF